MPTVGFHASHEQLAPSSLLAAVQAAEAAGFQAAMCSDHLAPWSERQGNSGHAWSWLGAALQATSLPFGVVTAPGQRYHPAIIAQAIATLGELFPGRFWAALGSGEAVNEHVTGEAWPSKQVRDARLLECVGVIRDLLAGREVSHDGLIKVDRARLWVEPPGPPDLIGAAVSEATAERCGAWADGLITVNQPVAALTRVLEAFRTGGGKGKPAYLQVHLSWAEDDDTARQIAHEQWSSNMFDSEVAWELDTPAGFDAAAKFVRPEDVDAAVLISSDTERHLAWLIELADIGFDGLFLHHVGQQQERFIETFGDKVIPDLAS
jgi:probable non-F420 flavinoid oxidoreductase